ncbi:uncharacterized protein LOC129351371 isoform X2 [Poeciliopsis prolifica]|uniref:uncharacterized protein LOC129351371 isoform X2 n=1 Tax=Poeciliopsis prolifica TaxID=188132 RepID=UPI002414589E|nr:uncharacterized protein LOC129351371 isoform X2 [Poeciliopsis prolifica]
MMLLKKNVVLGGIVVIFLTFLETVGGQDNKGSLISSKSSKEDKTAVIGTNITLDCDKDYTLQDNDILEWSKDSKDILIVKNGKIQENADEKRFSLTPSAGGLSTLLNILDLKDTDSGSYSCCIVNSERRCINQNVVVKNESSTKRVSDGKNSTSKSQNGTDMKSEVEQHWWLDFAAVVFIVVVFAAAAAADVAPYAAAAVVVAVTVIGCYYLFKEYKKRFNKQTGDETNIPLKTIP